MTLPKSTIEQWTALRTVIEEGSFAAAAAKMNRSQSSISYAIARLQDALGVKLLEMTGRRAVLTETGAALLSEATPLIDELNRIERRSDAASRGQAIRARVLIDALFPKQRLFPALEQIAKSYPHMELHLAETVRRTARDVADSAYDLAVLMVEPGATRANLVADIKLIAVAQAGHPLSNPERTPTTAELARYPRVEIRGIDSARNEPRTQGRLWRMNTVESAIEAVRHGMCYGWLPSHMIRHHLADGSLRKISLASGQIHHIALGLHMPKNENETDAAIIELARLLATSPDASEVDDSGLF